MRQLVDGDTRPGVADRDLDGLGGAPGLKLDVPAVRRELHGVAHDIADRLEDAMAIDEDRGQIGIDLHADRDRLGLCQRAPRIRASGTAAALKGRPLSPMANTRAPIGTSRATSGTLRSEVGRSARTDSPCGSSRVAARSHASSTTGTSTDLLPYRAGSTRL